MATGKACEDCRKKCGKGHVPEEILLELEEAYDIISSNDSDSLLKKHLKRPIFDMLKDIKTPMGATLLDCIRSGAKNLDSSMGLYAADPDAYAVYNELFDPIIMDYHELRKGTKHTRDNWGNPCELKCSPPDSKYIISTRIRCARSIDGYPFTPTLTEPQYLDLEKTISTAVKSLTGEYKGTYYPLKIMTKPEIEKLIDEHYLFKECDKYMEAGNMARFWPKGRGIFYTPKKNFLVWLLEEDHMRIISMQPGGDLKEVYKRLMDGVSELEKLLKFARSEKYGYLSSCPSNIGTSIRASVLINLPKLGADRCQLENLAKKYNLQVRGSAGEKTECQDGIYDISNKRRLGITEFQAVKEMCEGITAIIKQEEQQC